MKRYLILFLATVSVFGSVCAQTTISDSSFVSGTWTKANAPYIIEGELIVPEGTTLTIEPGVEVRFKTGTNFDYTSDIDVGYFNIYGKVIAIGNPGDSIVFTRDGNEGNWGILYFHEVTDSSIFKYAVFEHSSHISGISTNTYYNYFSGALSSFQSKMSIENCCFRHCKNYGVFSRGSTTWVQNNLFTYNRNAIFSGHWGSGGKDSIINNIMSHHSDIAAMLGSNYCYFSQNEVFANSRDGVYIDEASPVVIANTVHDNGDIGIHMRERGGTIINNHVYNNYYGIAVYYCRSGLVFGNISHDNKIGMVSWRYSTLDILNNTFVDNTVTAYKNWTGSSPVLRNNIFWNNTQTFEFESGFTISNSIISDSTLPLGIQDGKENIFGQYPDFQDSATNDFSLAPGSPAINNGYYSMDEFQIPEIDIAGLDRIKGVRIDIGAFEYQEEMEFLKITYPYYHRYVVSNLTDTLRWEANEGMTGSVTLKYSIDDGETWRLISSSAENTGQYAWHIPELISDKCKWLVTSNSNPEITDTSSYCFTISPNNIPDGTALYGTLKSKYSPYHIMGETHVPENSLLTIEPGCELRISSIDKRGGMIIYGKMEAIGKKDSIIVFTRDTTEGYWMNITYYSNTEETSNLSYCLVEHASSNTIGSYIYPGAVAAAGANLKISHSTFRNNQSSGVYASRLYAHPNNKLSFCEIENSLFYQNTKYGVDKYWSTINITNSTIAFNGYEGINGVDNVRNCIIYGNRGPVGTQYGPKISYSLMGQASLPSNVTDLGGNILGQYPQFKDSTNFDFHLRENAPCIDAGDPADNYSLEPAPNGGRINMGAYGNTPEAASFHASPRIDALSRTESSIFANDTLTIVGLYFKDTRGDGKVSFNGAEALAYLSWTDDEITCIVPPNPAIRADIIVSNNSGEQGAYHGVYQYSAPGLEKMDPEYASTTGPTIITMEGRNFGQKRNGVKVLFESTEAVSYITWTDTLIQITSPPGLEGLTDLLFIYNDSIKQRFTDSFLFTGKQVNAVCGAISGRWTQDTIYHISCPVTVEYGDSLIIEEGVIVIVSGDDPEYLISITINGVFEVRGSEESPVLFSAIPGLPGKWEGLILQQESNIQFAEIKHAKTGLLYEDGYNHHLNNSKISLSEENGIELRGVDNYPNLEITNSVISGNTGWGIFFEAHAGSDYGGSASGRIYENTIAENGSGGIWCKASGSTPHSFGLYPRSKTATVDPEIINNTILDNGGPGIWIQTFGDSDADGFQRRAYCRPSVVQNIISNNFGEGISIQQGWELSYSQPEIINCVVWDNAEGIIQDGGTSKIQNTIVWGDSEQGVEVRDGIFELSYSNLKNALPGTGNISLDPLFEDPSNLDFQLSPGSPCIDAGSTPGIDIDFDFAGKFRISDGDSDGSQIIDMGVYEFLSSFPMAITISGIDPTCHQGSNGSATATTLGGIPPYQFDWNDEAHTTGPTATGLRAGINYRVVITDGAGNTVRDSIILSEPEKIITRVTQTSEITCYGSPDGSAMVTASQGIAPYSYLWDDPAVTSGSMVVGLKGDIYYHVTVSDANGCSVIDSIELSQPEKIRLLLKNSSNISCHGLSDGSAEFVAFGGTSPYSYLWDNEDRETSSTAKGLNANQYYHLVVTDASGCQDSDSVMLTEPDELILELSDSTNISCYGFNDGSAEFGASGGTRPIDFLWNDAEGSQAPRAMNLPPNIYFTIQALDKNGCEAKDSVMLVEPEELTVEIRDSMDHFLIAMVQGGVSPYAYAWNTEIGASGPVAEYNAFDRFYQVDVSDAHGCYAFDTIFIQATGFFVNNTGSELKIFPNPTTDQVVVAFTNPDHQEYQLRISDLSGKIVDVEEGITSNRIVYSFGDQSRGFYLLELRGPDILRGIILVE